MKKESITKSPSRWRAFGLLLLIFLPVSIVIGALLFVVISTFSNFNPSLIQNTDEPNAYKELIAYANRQEIFIYDSKNVRKTYLANNYDVVSDEVKLDNKQEKQHVVTLQLKDSNYIFEVKSSRNKCEPFEALCIRRTYNITTTFNNSTYRDYIFTQYNQTINHSTKYNVQKNSDSNTNPEEVHLDSLIVGSEAALNYAVNYFDKFIDFCNQLTYRLPGHFSIFFNFPTSNSQFDHKTANASIVLNDTGNYIMTFPDGYEHDDTLKGYLRSFMKAQNITLDS